MVVSCGQDRRIGERDESPLFFTPSPDERPVSLTGALDDDSERADNTAFSGAAAYGCALLCPEGVTRTAQSCTSRTFDPLSLIAFDYMASDHELNSSLFWQQTDYSQQD
jgi:hypothetical protein